MSIKRRRGTLCKLVAVLAVLAVALVAGLGAAPRVARADEASLGVPEHEKSIVQNEDGTYTVTLNVKGATSSSSETVTTPVDIVLVVDQSTSMNDNDRMQNVRNAAIQLANSVLANNANGTVQISVVLFGTYTQDSSGNPKVGGSGWLTSADAVAAAIPTVAPNDQTGIFTNGNGTNWEAGLRDAYNVLQTGRDGAEKYVIFLSDGEPTYRLEDASNYDSGWFESIGNKFFDRTTGNRVYYMPLTGRFNTSPIMIGGTFVDTNNVEYVEGTGNTNPDGVNSDAALGIAQQINSSATFFSVSAESGTDNLMRNFHVAVTGSEEGFYSASDADSLNRAFDDIASIISSEASYRNVTITDTLSEWATGVTDTGEVTADGRVDPSTFTYMKGDEAWNDAPRATVQDDGTIVWALGKEFTLEDGVTYSVSFRIAPNQKAYDDAAAHGVATDYLSNGAATISYEVYKTVNGVETDPEQGDSTYSSPSMTVPVSTLTIQKVWDGEGARPDSITVSVLQSDGQSVEKYKDVTLTPDESGKWTATVVVPAGPEGYVYSLDEINTGSADWTNESIVVGDSDASSVEMQGYLAQSATFTVTNKPVTFALWVEKTDASTGTTLGDAAFDLYQASDDGSFSADESFKVNTESISIDAESGVAKIDGLVPGTTYYLLETRVPDGYQLRDEPYKIVVTSDGVSFASSPDEETLTGASAVESEDRTYRLSFQNEKWVQELPSTGGIGDVPIYVAGALSICGSVIALRKLRNS